MKPELLQRLKQLEDDMCRTHITINEKINQVAVSVNYINESWVDAQKMFNDLETPLEDEYGRSMFHEWKSLMNCSRRCASSRKCIKYVVA